MTYIYARIAKIAVIALLAGWLGLGPSLAVAQDGTPPHVMDDKDILILRGYISDAKAHYCNPNGVASVEPCSPPIIPTKAYLVGDFLPDTGSVQEVPDTVTSRMTDVAIPNSTYAFDGDNVYLIDKPSRRILDVVSLPPAPAP